MSPPATRRDVLRRQRRLEELAAALAWAWFARAFLRPGRYVTGFDTVSYTGPNLRFSYSELMHGRLPLWNDTIFGGTPHMGNIQTAVLYLPKLLFAGMNLNRAMSLIVASHTALLAVGLIVLVRRLGVRPPGGFVVVLVGLGSGAMLTRTTQFEQILVLAWAPWVLVAIHTVLTSSRPWRAVAGTSLVVAGMVLAGHPQMTYLVGLVAVVWTIGVVISARAWRRIGPLAVAGLAAGCLASLQLLATRAATKGSAITGGRGLDSLRLPDRSIDPRLYLRVLLGTVRNVDPGANAGAFETIGYVGVAAIVLAVVGAVCGVRSVRRRGPVVALAVITVVSVVLAAGSRDGLFRLLYDHLPGFDLMRVSGRWMTIADLAVAVLAAIGIDELIRGEDRLAGRTALAALAVGAVLIGVLGFGDLAVINRDALVGWIGAAVLVGVGAGLGSGISIRGRRVGGGAAVLVLPLAALGFELGLASRHEISLRIAAGASFTNYTSTPTEWLKGQAGWELALTGDRIGDNEYLIPGLRPNANTFFGIRSIDGYDGGVQVSKRWLGVVSRLTGSDNFELTLRSQAPTVIDPALAARFGVRWVLSDIGQASARLPGWRGPVVGDDRFEVYENPLWVGDAVIRRSGQPDTTATLSRLAPRRMTATASLTTPARLVVSSQWDEGWKIRVDGRAAHSIVADDYLLAVDLPAGEHRVTFSYDPDWVTPGVLATLVGLGIVVGTLAIDRRRHRPTPASTGLPTG